MSFNTLGTFICGEEMPSFLGLFDFSTAPVLLFYSYVPIIITAFFLGLFIFLKNKKSLQNKLFFLLVIFFILWVINILVQWVASYHTTLMFAWQLTAIFEAGIYFLTFYFAYVFLNKKDVSLIFKIMFLIASLFILFLVPTKFNVSSYDLQNCEGSIGILWNFLYSLEPIFILLIAYMGFSAYKKEQDKTNRKQIVLFTIGTILFLSLFFLSNLYGEITKFYEFNLWGPLGMLVFLVLIVYLIVRFHTFNLKVFATQALIWALVLLTGSQFFFEKATISFVLTGITFVAIIIFGNFLIKSVKIEIEQKEELVKLNQELQKLIQQRESLEHLITHKVKGSFTRTKYIFSEILEGSFGAISPELKKMAETGLESDEMGVRTVDLILNASNLQKGTVKFEMKPIDLKKIVQDSLENKKDVMEEKKLEIEKEMADENDVVNGDIFWIKEVVGNLIDNALNYTLKGKIFISLKKKDTKILFSVKDSGVGLSLEDKKNLFTEGGRGKDSVKINVNSTGYGLYSVKLIVEAHGGRVWAESEGPGKGSTFFVEFNAVN